MYSIVYRYEDNKVTIDGFEGVFECLKHLEDEGFDMSNPINCNTVKDGMGVYATITVTKKTMADMLGMEE